jgi:hypothetical protein
MKLNIASNLSAVLLTAQSMAGLSAQETAAEEDLKSFPVQIGFVYPMTTQGEQTVNYRYHLSVNMLTGKVGAVTGVELGGLINRVERDVQGAQFGGLYNHVKRDVKGGQFGGLWNTARTVNGAQFGGLTNISDNHTGVQFAGIANISEHATGIQAAGITNICKEVTGLQMAGIANMNEQSKGVLCSGIANITDKSEGFQLAGVANISNEVSGTGIAGIINRTGVLRGFQLGVVNVVDTVESGISMAVVNIVKKDFYREWALTFADYMNVGLSFKMGMRKFYSIFSTGVNFWEDNLWAFGFGFGNCTPLSRVRHIYFQPEIVSYNYYLFDFKNNQISSNHLKLGFVLKWNEKFGVVLAPGIYHLYRNLNDSGQTYKVSPVKEMYSTERNNRLHTFGAGISVGLIWR